jgi:hypothetical protein
VQVEYKKVFRVRIFSEQDDSQVEGIILTTKRQL